MTQPAKQRLTPALALIASLPLLLTACFGGDDTPSTPSPAFVVVPTAGSECEIVAVSPATSVTSAFINPLLTVKYTGPNLDVCNRLILQDAAHTPIATRVVAASEWAHPQGGVAGTLTLEPTTDLTPHATYGLLLRDQTISYFKTGTARRGTLVDVQDQPVAIKGLPASSRLGIADINNVLDVLLEDLAGDHPTEKALLEPLVKAELTNLARPNARFGAQVAKLTYLSSDASGAPVTLSGLLIYPTQDGTGPAMNYNGMPMVIGQRGAQSNEKAGPSSASQTMLLPGMVAAGRGHIYLAPDLIGVGDSKSLPQAYLVASQAAEHTQNMLRAARAYFLQQFKSELGRDIRVVGSSEGGFTTMAALPHLAMEGQVRYVSAAEGPYDVYRTFDSNLRAVGGAARDAYSRDEDLSLVADRFGSVLESMRLTQNLGLDPKTVFAADGSILPSFLTSYASGQQKALVTALGLNSLASSNQRYDLPNARIVMYHFTTDILVPQQNTVDMLARLNQQPNRWGSLQRGDCREDSTLAILAVNLVKSKLITHTLCVFFQLDDAVVEL